MGLQYLEMMRALADSDSSKWIIPSELTQFVSSFTNKAIDGQGQS